MADITGPLMEKAFSGMTKAMGDAEGGKGGMDTQVSKEDSK